MPAFVRQRHSLHRFSRRRLTRGTVALLGLWVLVAIGCLRVAPRTWWPAAFGAMTLPLALLTLAGALTLLVLARRWRLALVGGAGLLAAGSYVQRGVALRLPSPAAAPAATPQQVRVVSYNVRIFNTYAHLHDKEFTATKGQLHWLMESPADVLCLQEYYNQKDTRRQRATVFATTRQLQRTRKGFVSVTLENETQQFGMAIFSRWPIVRRGTIVFGKLTQNHAMWADVRRPATGDTLRIYNAHLQSMSLDENQIVQTTRRREWLDAPGLRLLRRFRNGAVRRSVQIDSLVAHVRRSPYPVIVAGDLNDIPYSYTYQQLARSLTNAHEAAGSGVGATYNGRLPLLRIDNQFCSKGRLVPIWMRVRRDVPFSDHYPLDVVYEVASE